MKIKSKKQVPFLVSFLLGCIFIFTPLLRMHADTGKQPLTFRDIMAFKSIRDAFISEDGQWVVYHVQPDRGAGEAVVYNIESHKATILRPGENPKMTADSRWVAAAVDPGKRKPKITMVLLDTSTGKHMTFQDVKSFEFSPNSQWLIYRLNRSGLDREQTQESGETGESRENNIDNDSEERKIEKKWQARTFSLVLLHLPTGREIRIDRVLYHTCDPSSRYLAYCTYGPEGEGNGLFVRDLANPEAREKVILAEPKALFTGLTWSPVKSRLAFIFHRNWRLESAPTASLSPPAGSGKPGQQYGTVETPQSPSQGIPMMRDTPRSPGSRRLLLDFWKRQQKNNKSRDFSSGLWVWDGIENELIAAVPREKIPAGWMIPADNRLQWTRDGERLFFGFKPYLEYLGTISAGPKKEPGKENKDNDPYSISRILEDRRVDVWHWRDPLINFHQKKRWERNRKKIYYALYYFEKRRFILLADQAMPQVRIPENPDSPVALGFSEEPYLREQSWDDRYRDVFICDLDSGSRVKILTRHRQLDPVFLSPMGRFIVYYHQKHWFLYDTLVSHQSSSDTKLTARRAVTDAIQIPFFDEDYDHPGDAPGYGIAGWTENDRSVIIYDKYDIWEFFTDPESESAVPFTCLTGGRGRKEKIVFRFQNPTAPGDEDAPCFKQNQAYLLTAFSEKEKYTIFYRLIMGKTGVQNLLPGEDNKTRTFLLHESGKTGRVLYTRESYDEFPDLWVSDAGFVSREKISDINPQKKEFLWGKSRLVEWESPDGIPLQGVLITPESFQKKPSPLLVICYERFSHMVHEFPRMAINNFPCLPYYSGHDYVLFLPDIRFETGKPGESAYNCIVPGVKKLIEMGIADPNAIGVYGHSWGGYLAVNMITRTDMFRAAVAGAPVVNLTGAYNAVRWGTGLSRQYHYEKSQGRMGKSLWEIPDLYIGNSPLFSADKIKTPLLIEFGDNDGVVPWTQGIELYLALRRLNRVCILLQYNDEFHHLKTYANKLDYAIKMEEFLDHYLKGKPGPEWIVSGEPYKKR
jgi:dipeptidyl aminopeptidase/acylaminoacyl peptidase